MLTLTKNISRWIDGPKGAPSAKTTSMTVAKAPLSPSAQMQTHNIYGPVTENSEVAKAISRLASCLNHVKSVSPLGTIHYLEGSAQRSALREPK